MKKIRILALILALLMLPVSLLVGCRKQDDDSDVDPSECKHKWNKWVEIAERDCTHEQIRERTCRVCGTKETETKAPWGHSLGAWVSDNNASCTADGTKSKKCQLCNYVETVADVGSALGHTFPDSSYIASEDDEYVEIATCIKCEAATDRRLLGLKLDFEGDKGHLSYTKLDEYFVEGAGAVESKTEGEGDTLNTYLSISRTDKVFAGNSAFGIVLTPRADMLKGTSLTAAPYYVVEFDVRLSKTETKDLILLSGTKKGVTENFIKYNSEDGTLVTAAGVLYTLKEEDYGRWLNIAVVLNDGHKEYTVYVDGYQLVYGGSTGVSTEIAYATVDGYYLGYDLDNLKIGLTPEVGVASSFDIDNIYHYLGSQPKNYLGSADAEYGIYTTHNGDKIVYKLVDADCTHTWGDTVDVPHTCISTGYSIKTCSTCGGQEISNVSTEALGNHSFVSVGTIEATCTESAFESRQCEKCGLKDGSAIGSPLGHEIDPEAITTVVIDPTCTERGYTAGKCKRCGINYESDYVAALGHEIDLNNTESYQVVAPTCLTEGYTQGHCKRCDLADYVTNRVSALGHTLDKTAEDYVKVDATCTADGYEESTCGRNGCNEKYKTNEVKAYGHSMVSKIVEVPVEGSTTGETKRVISSSCSRCKDADTQREMSTKVPTYDELKEIVGVNNILGEGKLGVGGYYFENDSSASIYGDDTKSVFLSKYGLVARYAKFLVRDDNYNVGNKYMEWVYSPQNCSSSNAGDKHAYFDYNVGHLDAAVSGGQKITTPGQDVVFEISLRRTEGESEVMPMSIQVQDRSRMVVSGNVDTNFLVVDKNGNVKLNSGLKIATLKEIDWTRIAVVFHTSTATFDVYIDGVMVEKNVLITLGEIQDKKFQVISYGFRINVDDRYAQNTRKIDYDEVYAYYGSLPAYVTDINLNEKTGLTAFVDDSKNTIKDGYAYPFIDHYTFTDSGTNRLVEFETKKNTRFFIDSANGNAIHLLKNADVPNIPTATNTTGSDSFMQVYLGYNAGKRGSVDMPGLSYQYKSILFETDLVINTEKTTYFNILTGRKNSESADNRVDFTFLEYKNGNIVSGDDVIVSGVVNGQKYTIAVVMRDYDYTYDIYVDGYLMRERVEYPAVYRKDTIKEGVLLRMFKTSDADVDILISNLKVRGGVDTPDKYLGRAEVVKVSGGYVSSGVVFTEDYDYTVHYPENKRANGDYVYNSKTGTLEIVSGLEAPINDLNLGLIKVDKDGKTGDEAVNEPVWALKTGNWRSNCTSSSKELSGLKFYLQNTAMKDGYYDLTKYDSITFKYYVAESAGYKFLITINCPRTNDKNCYYTYYVDIAAGTTGWQELTVPLSSFGVSNTPSFDKVTDITINFSGWKNSGIGAMGGNAGELGDGTTLYIAGIDLNSVVTDKILGIYVKDDDFCGDGNHQFGEPVTVEATSHFNKYTYKTCTAHGCGYVDLVEFEGTALGHKPTTGEPTSSSVKPSCKAEGVNYYDVVCDTCGNLTVGGKLYKSAHVWSKSEDATLHKAPTCTEDGYDTYVCSGCGTNAKLVVSKLGHTKDENVATVVVEATCEAVGYKQDHCSVCGTDYKYDEVKALGHTRDENVISVGGCTSDRVVEYTCSRCDWTDREETPGPGHNWGQWTTVKAATCGDGSEKRVCKDCGTENTRDVKGTGAHTYEKTETPADCGHNGSRVWTCKTCKDSYSETITATGEHSYGTVLLTKQATTDAEGYTYYECATCKRHKIVTRIPAIFEGTQDLVFEISGDVAIIGKYEGSATEIVIPATYAGKPVVVSKAAFSGNTNITSITLGNGVTLAQSAFKGCTALKTVVLGEGMTEIGVSTFDGCTELEAIVIPASVTKIDMLAFNGCTKLKTVTLLGTPATIAANAFKGCTELTTVNYVGAKALVATNDLKALGNDKFFGATWNCNYVANA